MCGDKIGKTLHLYTARTLVSPRPLTMRKKKTLDVCAYAYTMHIYIHSLDNRSAQLVFNAVYVVREKRKPQWAVGACTSEKRFVRGKSWIP
jgi:hypothetical protein